MGQIKYFPLNKSKTLSLEEETKWKEVQHWIIGAKYEMNNRIRNMPRYWQVIEKSLFHEKFKSRIKIVRDIE